MIIEQTICSFLIGILIIDSLSSDLGACKDIYSREKDLTL